jgi:hypothetical protein
MKAFRTNLQEWLKRGCLKRRDREALIRGIVFTHPIQVKRSKQQHQIYGMGVVYGKPHLSIASISK